MLSRIYLNGYFIKDDIDSFSLDIAYDLGYNDTDDHIAFVKEVIEYMMKINLLDSYSYEYESVFTSRAIQIQFVKSTLRRVPRDKPHHDYHRNNVKEVDKKKCGLSVGLSLAITAISMASIGIVSLIIRKEFIIIWTLFAFAISFTISTILVVIFIRKYNGSLFGN